MKKLGLILVCIIIYCKAPAQVGAFFTSGTEFLIPNMGIYQTAQFRDPIYNDTGTAYIQITASNATCVNVALPAKSFDTTFFLQADSSLLLHLPNVQMVLDTATNNTSIQVYAKAPVLALYLTGYNVIDSTGHSAYDTDYYTQPGTEMAAVSPSNRAAKNYILNCVNDSNYGLWFAKHHQFWLQAIRQTSINVLTYGFSFYQKQPPSQTYVIQMAVKDSYSNAINGSNFTAPQPNRGYAGSLFNASEPFLLFGGNKHYQTGTCFNKSTTNYGMAWADLYDQSKPPTYADTLFFAAQLQSHWANLYSALALQDSTAIYFNNQLFKTVNSGFQLDTCFGQDVVISSSKPLLLSLSSAVIADPNDSVNFPNSSATSAFTITLSGSQELIKRSIVNAPKEQFKNTNVVMLFTPSADTAMLTRNGQPLPLGSWQVYAARPTWAFAQVEIPLGTSVFSTTGAGFNGYWYNYVKRTSGLWYMPSYGTALTESVVWPQDSFVFRAGLDSTNLQPFSQTTPTLCLGQTLYLQASHLRHTTWQWHFGDGSTQTQRVGSQHAKPINYTWQSPGQYWVTVTDSAGCTNGDSLLVIVENGPQAAFSYTATSSCSGTFVQLQNETVGASSYNWQWPGGSSTATNPSFSNNGQDTTLTVTLIANDGSCTDTATQTLNIQPSTFNPRSVPNVLTPNNDGLNDAFCIPGTAGYQECFQLEIYNRWGTRVYFGQNPNDCWQPTNLAAGVYFYVLTLGKQQYQGEVTLF